VSHVIQSRSSTRPPARSSGLRGAASLIAGLLLTLLASAVWAQAPTAKPLPQRIADDFIALFGSHPGYRINHAKGLIVTGTFVPSASGASLTRAPHVKAASTPVIVRFSDATGLPDIPDQNPNTQPLGIAVRFTLPGNSYTDIVANSHNGFVVGTGEDFAEFLEAVAATKPTSPHPSPIEKFLGGHPRSLKFVQDPKPMPVGFGNDSYYGNNALVFVNAAGVKQYGRYQILPVDGNKFLDSAATARTSPNFLFDELPTHLAKRPIKFRLLVQLANPGDVTSDGSIVWPADRKTVELGVITLTTVALDNANLQKTLAFNPIYLSDGIQLGDDPLITLRSAVYALSVARRR
jgi:catalase